MIAMFCLLSRVKATANARTLKAVKLGHLSELAKSYSFTHDQLCAYLAFYTRTPYTFSPFYAGHYVSMCTRNRDSTVD